MPLRFISPPMIAVTSPFMCLMACFKFSTFGNYLYTLARASALGSFEGFGFSVRSTLVNVIQRELISANLSISSHRIYVIESPCKKKTGWIPTCSNTMSQLPKF